MTQASNIEDLARRLSEPPLSVAFDPGLSDVEVQAAEDRFGFHFPPDLRRFLQSALPTGKRFPNWRELDSTELLRQVQGPIDGCLFDVRNNVFWMESWDPRPQSADEAEEKAAVHLTAAPKLIPIYGHRYICEVPNAEGNPVLSVSQTDIIYYGSDLADYLRREFFSTAAERRVGISGADVPFWSEVMIVGGTP